MLAPDEPDILGLIREVAPALAAGNTVVAIVSRRWPLRALDLGEVAGVSDVPGGVLNLLCGRMDELLTPLCGHRDVNAIVDATGDSELAATIDELAAETVKRVTRPAPDGDTLARLEALMELKTAWHPVGTVASPCRRRRRARAAQGQSCWRRSVPRRAEEREPPGDVQQPVAQPFGLGLGELAVEQQRLGPDEQVVREQHDLQPDLVERERLERELGQAGVLVVADAVLDVGVLAVAALDRRRCSRRAGR